LLQAAAGLDPAAEVGRELGVVVTEAAEVDQLPHPSALGLGSDCACCAQVALLEVCAPE
jgi:hypothetical protein